MTAFRCQSYYQRVDPKLLYHLRNICNYLIIEVWQKTLLFVIRQRNKGKPPLIEIFTFHRWLLFVKISNISIIILRRERIITLKSCKISKRP